MNGCYIMSNGSMVATDQDFLNDLSIETRESENPPAFLWAEAVAKALGYNVTDEFPVDFEGQGVAILHRDNYKDSEAKLPFQFLAILSTSYDEDVMIGIPDVPDLLDFYAKVQPLLMLRTSPRFIDVTDSKGVCPPFGIKDGNGEEFEITVKNTFWHTPTNAQAGNPLRRHFNQLRNK